MYVHDNSVGGGWRGTKSVRINIENASSAHVCVYVCVPVCVEDFLVCYYSRWIMKRTSMSTGW